MPLVRVYHSKGMSRDEALDGDTVAAYKMKIAAKLHSGGCTLSKTKGGGDDFPDDALCGQCFKRGMKLYATVLFACPHALLPVFVAMANTTW